jgi:hypothetical protein
LFELFSRIQEKKRKTTNYLIMVRTKMTPLMKITNIRWRMRKTR